MKFTFQDRHYVLRSDLIRGISTTDNEITLLLGTGSGEVLALASANEEELVSVREAAGKWERDWYKR
jgi:hypothetical protein